LRVLAALVSAIGVGLVIVVVVVLNAGFVYRVECPRAGGSTETEWTYRWQSLFPYIGYSRSGCESHTATRVALDAVGLWAIDDGEGGNDQSSDHSSEYPPDLLASMVDGCVSDGESREFCQCALDEFTLRVSAEEAQSVAEAFRTGAARYDELPEGVRGKVQDAVVAAETDCRGRR
jgi:hypothetical protein